VERINVAFQDGFDRDAVIAFLDEREVWRSESVTTRTQIGLAASADFEVDNGNHRLRINVPSRGLECERELQIPPDTNVGVSIVDGQIRLVTSAEPFHYA
jgi:hypothetical protein